MKYNFHIIFFVLILVFMVIFMFRDSSVDFYNKNQASAVNSIEPSDKSLASRDISPISGISCENYNRRPLAVMMANDPVARPLSGISRADLIIEMEVITGSITRIMAFFICEEPKEIGALRSARHDFIPLAMGFDGVFAHWGGSHYALDKLARGIMDNINALYNPFGTFYRKSGLPVPHNGFTSYDRLWIAVKKLGYSRAIDFEPYSFEIKDKCDVCKNGELVIDYSQPYNVSYDYNFEENSYARFRYGYPELDGIDSSQVKVKNVIIMRAGSRQIEKDYNDVDVEGSGKLIVYKNGEEVFGSWEKSVDDPSGKLYFYNEDGDEIKLVPGKTVIEIVAPNQKVEYKIQK